MKNKHALSIVLIGNELLNGDIQDKNAQYLLKKINGTSLYTHKVVQVRDVEEDIIKVVLEEMSSSRLVVCSGGLGPTSDDITVSSIAKALSLDMYQDDTALKRLEEKYIARGRPLNKNSFKQVQFPKGAEILANEVGTADSCLITKEVNSNLSSIVCLPGVPREFTHILDTKLSKWIEDNLAPLASESSTHLRIFGIAESDIGTAIDSSKIFPQEISLAYRPQFPEILLSLKSEVLSVSELDGYVNKLSEILDSTCFFTREKDEKLPFALCRLLTEKGKTIAFAESCTGGRLSSEITKVPGSSKVFKGSVISYSNEMKQDVLDVPQEIIKNYGAVSKECVLYMAESIFKMTNADYAVSISGIAGPSGDTTEKKVGTIYFGFKSKDKHLSFNCNIPWDRERNQIYASWLSMDLIRRELLGYEQVVKTL